MTSLRLTEETTYVARAAAVKLAACERPHTIERYQAGDEDVLCGSCLIGIVWTSAGWRHNPEELRDLRAVATTGAWPRG